MRPLLSRSALLYAGLAVALWPWPVLGVLHVESSAIVAAAAFFVAGGSAVRAFRRGARLRAVLTRHLALLTVPWVLLTLSLLWRPNCEYVEGLALYEVFALPSAALGVALAWALTGAGFRRPTLAVLGIGLALVVGGVVYDLGFHPQFYTYNHVFGGVLGPIYDEELALRPGLFLFRGVTLCWAAWLIGLGTWLRARREGRRDRRATVLGAVCALLLGAAYLFAEPLGFTTTEAGIARRLGGRFDAGRFIFFYDPAHLRPPEVERHAQDAAYRYDQLRARLGSDVPERIRVYLYPNPDTKAALTGARTTSVTPVWLARPQMHLLQIEMERTFAHELAHLFAREFGLPVLNASLAVGLVEGLAVAVEPPDGLPPMEQQVAAALQLPRAEAGRLADGPAEAVAASLSPLGFWTGRGAATYATSGAFVRYLLDHYGADRLRRVYARADFVEAYGRSVEELAGAWEAEVRRARVTEEARAYAAWVFAQPSLFERRCPHHVPRWERLTEEAREAEAAGQWAEARLLFREALEARADYGPALVGWAERALGASAPPEEVVRRLRPAIPADTVGDPLLLRALGDALRLAGDSTGAMAAYERALDALPPYARGTKAALRWRAALSPEALWFVLAGADPTARAEALERRAVREPAAWPFAAALRAETHAFERAFADLLQMPPPGDAPLARARLGALADLAWQAGRFADADRLSREAAAGYLVAGEESAAHLWADRAARARYAARLPPSL